MIAAVAAGWKVLSAWGEAMAKKARQKAAAGEIAL
jgi:hypothetical protein